VGSLAASNIGATTECGEPVIASEGVGTNTGATVWYSWTAPFDGRFAFTTDGDRSLDSVLAVYTGDAIDALTLIGSDDDSGEIFTPSGIGPAKVVFDAGEGATYRIAVGGYNSGAATFQLNWAPVPANDDFADGQMIAGSSGHLIANNLGASHEAGEPGHTAALGSVRSIWYRWQAPASERVLFHPVGSDWFADAFVYTGDSVDGLTAVPRAVPQFSTPEAWADTRSMRSPGRRTTLPWTAGAPARWCSPG
jgi:hypothetical protein